MKVVIGTMILAVSALLVSAQETTVAPPEAKAARVIAELAATTRSTVKNAPLSCDEVNESVQTLGDGNRIVRSSTGKMYRNSEGRVRREIAGGVGGMMGSMYSTGTGVSIVNPALGQQYLLDLHLKTATVMQLAREGRKIAGARAATEEEKAKVAAKLKTDLHSELKSTAPIVVTPGQGGYATTITGTGHGGVFTYSPGGLISKYETRTEELGTRDFEGVSAEGTRKTTIIPAGAIGNERPLEIVYERWFSKELGLVVFSRNSDPRFGEQTYKLTNIVRSEPDPSLFSVPTEYRKIGENGAVYRLSSPKANTEKNAAAAKAVRHAVEKTRPL